MRIFFPHFLHTNDVGVGAPAFARGILHHLHEVCGNRGPKGNLDGMCDNKRTE